MLLVKFVRIKPTHHLVNLLKRQTSRLRDEEVGPEDAATAEAAPDEEHFGAKVAVRWVDHVGDDDAWGLALVVMAYSVARYWEWCLPMMQFQNQLAAVEMATPLERMGSWKISPMMTQPAGPQVLEMCQ
jgi:hypothetical protein